MCSYRWTASLYPAPRPLTKCCGRIARAIRSRPFTSVAKTRRIPRSPWQHGRDREAVVKDAVAAADKRQAPRRHAAAKLAALKPLAVRVAEAAPAAPASLI